MFEEKREEFSTQGTTSGGIPATMATVNATLICHQGSTPKCSSIAAPVILGTMVRCSPGRAALGTVTACVPSSDWCLQLAGILHSKSVCSAASHRLKPSLLPKTLRWRCNFLSHLGATALLMPFCPGSKEVWNKKGSISRAVWEGWRWKPLKSNAG